MNYIEMFLEMNDNYIEMFMKMNDLGVNQCFIIYDNDGERVGMFEFVYKNESLRLASISAGGINTSYSYLENVLLDLLAGKLKIKGEF